jgi:hypothetical protein
MLALALSRRALCLLPLVAAVGCKPTVTVTVERAEIQQRLQTAFPVEQPLLLGKVTFDNPRVELGAGGDRIGVELDARLELPLLPVYSGKVAVSGKPAYRAAEKAFYLQDATLDRFEIAGLPPAQVERFKGPTTLVARTVLDRTPVYTLEQRNFKEVTAEHVLREVRVKDGRFEAVLGP